MRRRLNEIGVRMRADLARVGPVAAYRQICANYPDRTIPVCYYLYSLEGALTDTHWDALPSAVKGALYSQAKEDRNRQGRKRRNVGSRR